MDGGLMTSFHTNRSVGEDETPEFAAGAKSAKGRSARGNARARKSKEQKQAEKDSAARGQAYLDQGQDLPPLAPKKRNVFELTVVITLKTRTMTTK
ncbi:hypothetical protein AMS68_004108 [Peltaster fructicola]|uniref:Uncharacterized protein n=1 Tax=Peltaster fructicola TaxID=286661 RepID=A0A6H0XVA8_9PEZI|nr:hypothetical protein AMS68_004108 [Peltaster fructicola]